MNLKLCDRCGCVIEDEKDLYTLMTAVDCTSDTTRDLCKSCRDEILNEIDNHEKGEIYGKAK